LNNNEFVEVGVGEQAARALGATANDDVFQLTRLYVAIERLD
jgi:hypothetical protein